MSAALEWLKKWWSVFAAGVVTVLAFIFYGRKKHMELPPVPAPDEERAKIEQDTQKALDDATKRKDAAEKQIQAEYLAKASAVLVQEKTDAEQLANDPDKTNAFLLNVGKQVRDTNEK